MTVLGFVFALALIAYFPYGVYVQGASHYAQLVEGILVKAVGIKIIH